ncbi:uncharacterized protein BXZ73DRAFT_89541 [Epithele typhae]|uniref:uncharacterized protein n=1 Tax=Epithele typhae TaxID=378194 RepID=UPI0020081869|nr:uncharacterized protein BXZ73DRAFT_89541 [Epithele typhae]KAH9935203.1 hypothetical protein BXZ73DRAFT_89541 [Epithele typhae]
MSARRQASTTSLSQFARSGSPDPTSRSNDFCNAFWGLGDGGADVLFARMRGGARTVEELKNFWKERAIIEEQYAKRLAGLSKFTLGRDEIGELRAAIDTLKQETEKQAASHLVVAQAIKAELEVPSQNFIQKQQQHKRGPQAAIEKDLKNKQTQEGYVARAREKYEQDCMRINSYTAQSTLIQGRDLEKVHMKLERAQQTVQANQRDYANFARALQDTMQKWERSWKEFCDTCQDLEEERIEFMKDNMWAYANAVSTVCVSDDESCEMLRLALEQLEVERDMEGFVRDYGTGGAIPDPPPFIDYSSPDAQPASSQRPTTHSSSFVRQSRRPRQPLPPQQGPPEPEEDPVNMTGVGTGPQLSNVDTRSRQSLRQDQMQPPNGGSMTNGRATPNVGMRPADPQADPIDPTARTMLKVGAGTYEVDLAKDPQAHVGPTSNGSQMNPRVGQDDDPIARQMNELKSQGTVRRSGQFKAPSGQQSPPDSIASRRDPTGKLSPPPGGAPATNRDYRKSAEFVVGSLPPQAATSRPASPNPITNVFMKPPQSTGPGGMSVQTVLADYQQSLPGERKSISRSNSRSNSKLARPTSSGVAGIGAQGRSPSPQPFGQISRSASPAAVHRNSFSRPPTGQGHTHSGSNARQGSISIPQQPAHQQRPTSPGIGIQLDPSGRVVADEMASQFRQPQQGPPAGQPPAQNFGAPPAQQKQMQRRPSYNAGPNGAPYVAPSPAQQQYAGAPAYGAPPAQQPPYQQPPPPQQAQYGAPPPQQQYPGYQQPPQHTGYPSTDSSLAVVSNRGSMNGYYQPPQQPPQQQPQQPPAAPAGNQPPPTGQYTDDGRGVLFYVKAMYNYRATIEEEFDFQEGDIIAVTATPEDGWWSGELLDEGRRQPGRHIFPSNFVCLF